MNSKRAKKLRKEAGGFGPSYEQLKKDHLRGEPVEPKRKLSKRYLRNRHNVSFGNSFGAASLYRFDQHMNKSLQVKEFNKNKEKQIFIPKRKIKEAVQL